MRPFSLLVMLGMVCYVNGQACPMGTLGDQCRCESNNPGTFKITCTCKPGENFVISDGATAGLSSAVTAFHIKNCNSSVTVKSHSFDNLFYLENLSFSNISSLTLEPSSLEYETISNADLHLTIDTVLYLSLKKEAIKLMGQGDEDMGIAVTVRNSFVIEMAANSISGYLKELNLENLVFGTRMQPHTIDVGSRGCKIIINNCDASNFGFESEWIVGSANHLSLINNSLTLMPDSFAGINITGNQPTFVLENNILGASRWSPGGNGSRPVPSLPVGSFGFNTPDPSEVQIEASNNVVTCACTDLAWILEGPSNHIKKEVKASLKCSEGSLNSAINKCRSPNEGSVSTLNLATASMLTMAIVYLNL